MNLLDNRSIRNLDEWKSRLPYYGGLILINKPTGITSFDVIKILKRAFPNYKIGHSGTLDPLASGVLLVAIGKLTKRINELTNQDKEYNGIIKLGATTPSLDKETIEIIDEKSIEVNEFEVLECAKAFIGEIYQTPPHFSALKVQGKPSYEYARQKQNIEIQPRKVTVYDLQILQVDFPFVSFNIKVSKGFYVRQFASDFAMKLNTKGYLYCLTRLAIGNYKIENSIEFSELMAVLSNYK